MMMSIFFSARGVLFDAIEVSFESFKKGARLTFFDAFERPHSPFFSMRVRDPSRVVCVCLFLRVFFLPQIRHFFY